MKKSIFYPLCIVIAFISGLLIFNFIIMPLLVQKGATVTVPDVCGKEEDEAIQIIRDARLKVTIQNRRFDPVIEKGKVIIQEPLPGKKIKTGRVVSLTISKGIEKIAIPYILAIELEKARQILAKYELEIGQIESTFCDTIPVGQIVSTTPEPGKEIPKGSKVSVVLSLGKGIVVPDLTGLKIEEATTIIKQKGLTLGLIKEIEGSGEPGTIIVQTPSSGNVVVTGDSINLVIVKKKGD